MELLIECCVKILSEEVSGLLEPCLGHLRGPAVLGLGDISLHSRHLPQSEPDSDSRGQHQAKQYAEQSGAQEEGTFFLE